MTGGPSVLIVAGEASADTLGATLLRELREACPSLSAYGIGSQQLCAEGLEAIADSADLSVVGLADWFGSAGGVFSTYRKVRDAVWSRKTDLAILIDLPDFNLRLAGELKSAGIPVVYYASPQVWAWRGYRVAKIRRLVDRMLVILPFEEEFYRKRGVPAKFVGHPLRDLVVERAVPREGAAIRAKPRIAVLPGSRKSELRYHTEPLRDAAARLRAAYPDAEFRLPVASTLSRQAVEDAFKDSGITVTDEKARSVVAWADVALVASGTATLETALIGTPFVLFYALHPATAWLARTLFAYRGFFGLPNLLLGGAVAPELLFEKANGVRIAEEARRFLEDDDYRAATVKQLARCRPLLGTPGASRRAAEAVLDELRRRALASPLPDGDPLLA